MDFEQQSSKIYTDDSLMELRQHGSDAFPFRYYYEDMALFDFNCVDWHWHTELEFVFIQSGRVSFDVGQDHFVLAAGNGVLINSRILHRMQAPDNALIPNFLFLPSLLAPEGSRIYEKYVAPFLASSREYVIFRPEIAPEAEILEAAGELIAFQNTGEQNELRVSMLLEKFWLLFSGYVAFIPSEDHTATLSRARLQLMMAYIHRNYAENIALEDIAAAATISKSTALNLFETNLHLTPVRYLIRYRLKQAALQLTRSEKKVSAIAFESGFHSVDHFCRTFKSRYCRTPSEYRAGAASTGKALADSPGQKE